MKSLKSLSRAIASLTIGVSLSNCVNMDGALNSLFHESLSPLGEYYTSIDPENLTEEQEKYVLEFDSEYSALSEEQKQEYLTDVKKSFYFQSEELSEREKVFLYHYGLSPQSIVNQNEN
jgi:hypothetical protein